MIALQATYTLTYIDTRRASRSAVIPDPGSLPPHQRSCCTKQGPCRSRLAAGAQRSLSSPAKPSAQTAKKVSYLPSCTSVNLCKKPSWARLKSCLKGHDEQACCDLVAVSRDRTDGALRCRGTYLFISTTAGLTSGQEVTNARTQFDRPSC